MFFKIGRRGREREEVENKREEGALASPLFKGLETVNP
jgi:hypothetical protein